MKFGICNEIFKSWKFKKVVPYIRELGYEGIEIAPFTFSSHVDKISHSKRKEIRKACKDSGIEVIGLHWLLAGPENLSITSPDKKVRGNTVEYLKKLIDLCEQIGGTIMVFGSPQNRNIQGKNHFKEAWGHARDVFTEAAECAAEHGITICLEPLSSKDTNFITTHKEAIRMIQEVDRTGLKLHLDVRAMSYENNPIPEVVRNARKYLAHFHVNDKNLRGPGTGDIDFVPIRDALNDIKYSGYISVEVFDFNEGAEAIAENSIAYLKSVFEK